jgi:3D (Asp-Asp-Asp) domain-containing protein
MNNEKRTPKEKAIFFLFCLFLAVLFVGAVLLTAEPSNAQDKPTDKETSIQATTELLTEIKQAYVEVSEATEESPVMIPLGNFYITGYTPTCSHCCGKSDGIGASGRKIKAGKSVAMNRTDMKALDLEYGDKIYIPCIGERVIEDTGCIQGVIDVACDSHESCYKITGYYQVKAVLK